MSAGARLEARARDFARASLALVPVLALLRAYEIAIVGAAHVLPPDLPGLLLRGLAADAVLLLLSAALLAPLVIALGLLLPRAAERLHRGLLVALVLLAVGLAQYFAVTYVPLGADVFGYSPAEIRETVFASGGGAGLASLLPFAAFGALTWWLSGLAVRRLPLPRPALAAFFLAVLGAVALRGTLLPRADRFASDAAFFLASNKTLGFAADAARLARSEAPADAGDEPTGYPLLRQAAYPDVLGPLLELPSTPPNVVVVIVEGLGRDFVGPDARWGGFLPFMDSLTTRGLYWENFLSTSGRTFGVLPALLGSLPPGEQGFMELATAMPRHASLVSLLGEQGYQTSYFGGANGQFDFVDVFMERQGVDRFVDQSRFGPEYQLSPGPEGGESWGYADRDVFQRSLEVIGAPTERPRLDVYQTNTSHEPFIPPQPERWRAAFRRRLAELPLDEARRREFATYESIFSTLLYVDDSLRWFMEQYSRRPDFARTLFVITGDHRLIPLPPGSRIDRYHVPFLIVSPMVREPRRFASVSSHRDVAPSLLAMLGQRYGLDLPAQAHWLGEGIDTARAFRSVQRIPLMRTKGTLDEYVRGDLMLSQGQLFRLLPGMGLRPESDPRALAELQRELNDFRRVNRYVLTRDRLYPGGARDPEEERRAAREDSLFAARGLDSLNTDQRFTLARERAGAGDYEEARLIARLMLRRNPSLHDVRTLLGRTYAWEKRFDEARPILEDVVRRAPEYVDGRVALIDLELFQSRPDAALARADSVLAARPGHPDVLIRRATALERLGRRDEARDAVRPVPADHPEAAGLRARLGG